MEDIAAPHGSVVTAIDCLGAARLLVLDTDARSSQRFLQDTLGPLLHPADARHQDLLDTLVTFLGSGRNIRACAREMHVHENTIRYRLSRAQELLGLDVANDAEAQLTLQLAITVRGFTGVR